MAKASKATASQTETMEGFEGHWQDLGGYTIGFEAYSADADPGPLFRGLPNDHCQCPHWGYVLKGKLIFRYEDGSVDEILAGEGYYARPGHLPLFTEGTEIVEFSPTAELGETMEVVLRNVQPVGA